jgi:hypothetical protein
VAGHSASISVSIVVSISACQTMIVRGRPGFNSLTESSFSPPSDHSCSASFNLVRHHRCATLFEYLPFYSSLFIANIGSATFKIAKPSHSASCQVVKRPFWGCGHVVRAPSRLFVDPIKTRTILAKSYPAVSYTRSMPSPHTANILSLRPAPDPGYVSGSFV